jgi:hypothetical protein
VAMKDNSFYLTEPCTLRSSMPPPSNGMTLYRVAFHFRFSFTAAPGAPTNWRRHTPVPPPPAARIALRTARDKTAMSHVGVSQTPYRLPDQEPWVMIVDVVVFKMARGVMDTGPKYRFNPVDHNFMRIRRRLSSGANIVPDVILA